jgi:ketosteroid isomerase-like protein
VTGSGGTSRALFERGSDEQRVTLDHVVPPNSRTGERESDDLGTVQSDDARTVRGLFEAWEEAARSANWSAHTEHSEEQREALAAEVARTLRRFLHPDAEYIEDPAWPGAGTYRGRDAVAGAFAQYWESIDFDPPKLDAVVEHGDALIASYSLEGAGRGSHSPFRQSVWWAIEMREGLIWRFSAHFDRNAAMSALGGR